MASKVDFASNPVAQSCRLLDFEEARVDPGIVANTFFLTVRGIKPCLNMVVTLNPRIYVRCPTYWEIEVVGCLPNGICLHALGQYEVTISLTGITGSVGVEVVGATRSQQFEVTGGCKEEDQYSA